MEDMVRLGQMVEDMGHVSVFFCILITLYSVA